MPPRFPFARPMAEPPGSPPNVGPGGRKPIDTPASPMSAEQAERLADALEHLTKAVRGLGEDLRELRYDVSRSGGGRR